MVFMSVTVLHTSLLGLVWTSTGVKPLDTANPPVVRLHVRRIVGLDASGSVGVGPARHAARLLVDLLALGCSMSCKVPLILRVLMLRFLRMSELLSGGSIIYLVTGPNCRCTS